MAAPRVDQPPTLTSIVAQPPIILITLLTPKNHFNTLP